MSKKNIIIEGDKFQKEYKEQYKKDIILNIVQAVILLIISISGILGSKFLLKVGIIIFPVLLLSYAINSLTIAYDLKNINKNKAIGLLVESILIILIALYIIFNPINVINMAITLIGIIVLINGFIRMIYYPNSLPVGSLILGIILILFSSQLIDILYTVLMVILLIYGIIKMSDAIYKIKNK